MRMAARRSPVVRAVALLAVVASIVIAGLGVTPRRAAASPESVARAFLESVRAGDVTRAGAMVDHGFYARDGRAPFLFSYEVAREPCVAFMVGRPFEIGPATDVSIGHGEAFFSPTRRASLRIAVEFDAARYRPLVLPDALASGRSIRFIDLVRFAKQPDRRYLPRITLQARPTLAPGLIAPPVSPRVKVPPPPGPPGARAVTVPPDSVAGGLGPDAPRDPGAVQLPSGEALTREQVEAFLPRIRAVVFKVYLRRATPLSAWKDLTIWPVEIVVVSEGAELRIELQA